MTDNSEPQKFELYVSAETREKIDVLIGAGKVGSTSEALLLAVDLGLDQLAQD